ncbi:hypothetical protein BKA58DRAFT_394494 [Alternaria rosae]|uniref:uncharacterized protein n=1 Tax=Alternaria rosae TaxID=1187941 RepID=UPI001E8D344E|nr:uncharacterized protein BKA58DRAFT_394494 [Alternaria rosae]KAH6852921.1 hypothetical protein BKA58DRAFT_394494 [Alternaria rosae]
MQLPARLPLSIDSYIETNLLTLQKLLHIQQSNMEQTKALNALEPFLALSKSATSPRAASDLIVQATSAPNTYVFAELLQTPNIQNLRSSEEYASYLTLLEIFAWGTWEDYKAQANLPKLSAQQHQKLLLLSLLPLSHSHATLTYKHLMTALELPTTRALEELITTAIYSGLITATLDPAHSLVSVTSISPLRDLAPGSLPALQNTLQSWSQRCDSALADLEAQVAKVKKEALDREKMRRKKERAFEAVMTVGDEKNTGKRNLMGMGGDDAMEIDEDSSGRTTRGTKRGPGGFSFGGSGRR